MEINAAGFIGKIIGVMLCQEGRAMNQKEEDNERWL